MFARRKRFLFQSVIPLDEVVFVPVLFGGHAHHFPELLDEVAQFLLMKETITGEELMRFVNAENQPQLPQPEETEQQDDV